MKRTTHAAFWRTWQAKAYSVGMVLVAMAPQLAPPDLAAWFREQFPGLPSWASWGIALLIGAARLKGAAKALEAQK